MSEYTSTIDGFQRAMEWSLTGPPEEAHVYAEATMTATFYHVMNGRRSDPDEFVRGVMEWRGRITEYKPVVDEFLRDGDRLAAHMTGTVKVDGADTTFESFIFAKVEEGTGKMEWVIERSIWGPVGGAPEHGEK
ncbi:putative mitochondrial substrate carrier protein [Rosellinia necatrix]|uniref:Putative mitochondrial substrate carrier protein n=1 Tax=Rosellinia necatrix TaxID=77044 RepID=A0A1W2TQ79_ROSNE|nr:putative mitochondrial substrate carrier protein [Rosellinia necatrix]